MGGGGTSTFWDHKVTPKNSIKFVEVVRTILFYDFSVGAEYQLQVYADKNGHKIFEL